MNNFHASFRSFSGHQLCLADVACPVFLCLFSKLLGRDIFQQIYIYTFKGFQTEYLTLLANTAAIFSQINETLNYHGIFCIIWRHIKVFAKCFHGKSVSALIWWTTTKGNWNWNFVWSVSWKLLKETRL